VSNPSTSWTVLVVDDEYSVLDALTEVLLWQGHHVLTAGNGVEALQVMSAQRPHLALVDVMMPRMDGIQLLQAMAADPALAVIPLILLTAVPSAVPPAVAARVTVLRKPFGLDGLLEAMEQVLGVPEAPADEA